MSGECDLLSSVSSQQRFEATDIKALGMSQLSDSHVIVLGKISFIQKIKENTSSRHEGMPTQKMRRERERQSMRGRERETPGPLAPLFIWFSPPLGLPCVNWASQECCLFYLRSSLRSSDLPLFYFLQAFPFLVFQPPLFWTPVSYSTYLTILTTEPPGKSLNSVF